MRIVAVALAGLVGAAVLGAAGFAALQAGLPPPTRAQRVAARASVWLHNHRLAVDEFRVDGRSMSGACLRGWLSNRGEPPSRGSFLVLESGTVWFGSSIRRVSLLRGPKQARVVGRLEATVGCTKGLRDMLFAALQTGTNVQVASTHVVDGQSAIALGLPAVHGQQMTLYVSARTSRPLLAVASAGSHEVRVHLHFVRGTPATLARLDLAHLSQRGHGG